MTKVQVIKEKVPKEKGIKSNDQISNSKPQRDKTE